MPSISARTRASRTVTTKLPVCPQSGTLPVSAAVSRASMQPGAPIRPKCRPHPCSNVERDYAPFREAAVRFRCRLLSSRCDAVRSGHDRRTKPLPPHRERLKYSNRLETSHKVSHRDTRSGHVVSWQRRDVNLPPDPTLKLMAVAIRWVIYTIPTLVQARSCSRRRRGPLCGCVVNR